MLLVVDIGNTNITLGIFNDDELIATFRLTTTLQRTSDEYSVMIMSFMQTHNLAKEEINDIIIASVVPKIMHSFINSITKTLNKEPIIIGPGVKTGISINTDNPREVGADRIVDLVGAYYCYGGNTLVVDFGTATTFDYIDEKGVFSYGVTIPGIQISSQALSSKAAKLPEIELKKPKSILATNTVDSMQAGIVYGYIGQCEYIINKFKETLKKDFKVIATGGLGRLICQETPLINEYDPTLTFKGLNLIYKRTKR